MTWKWARIPQESKHQHYHILNLQIGLIIYKRFKQSKSSNRAHLKHHMNLSLNRTHTHTHTANFNSHSFIPSVIHSIQPLHSIHSHFFLHRFINPFMYHAVHYQGNTWSIQRSINLFRYQTVHYLGNILFIQWSISSWPFLICAAHFSPLIKTKNAQ